MSNLLLLLLLLTISHLTQNIPTVSGHPVFLVVTAIRPLISLRRVWVVPAPRETKVSNATMAVATLGTASKSAARRQASNQVLEVVRRGGEVLRKGVQAVVKAVGWPHSRLQANHMIRQPALKKFSCKPEAIWRRNRREIRSCIPEAIRPNQKISNHTEILIRRSVDLLPTKTTLSQQAKAKRRSIAESAKRSLACALGCKALRECLPTVVSNTRSRSSSRAPEAARNGSEMKK